MKLGYDLGEILGFEIFGLDFISEEAANLVGRNLLKLDFSKFKSDLLTWDFVFDLSNPKAAEAYEKLMKATWKLKRLKGSLPFTDVEKFGGIYVSDIRPAEELAKEEIGKPLQKRSVARLFKGKVSTTGKRRSFKLGLKLLSFERKGMKSWNRILSYDELDRKRRYVMALYSHRSGWRMWFGFAKEESEISLYSIVPTDAEWHALDQMSAVYGYTVRDKKATAGEMRDYLRAVEAVIGKKRLRELCDPSALEKKVNGLSLMLTVAFPKRLIDRIAAKATPDDTDIWKAFAATSKYYPMFTDIIEDDDAITTNPMETIPAELMSPPARYEAVKEIVRNSVLSPQEEEMNWWMVQHEAQYIRKILRSRDTIARTKIAVKAVEKDSWLRAAMGRVLIELLSPYERGDDKIYIHLMVKGKGIESVDAHIGKDPWHELYNVVQDIIYNVNDNSYRMR